MRLLIIGIILFFLSHSVSIINPQWRDRMVQQLGENTWKGLYSLIALTGLVLIVMGYGEARMSPTVLYQPPVWLRDLALLLMLPVFPLFVSTYLPGRIKTAAKHPTLVATKLWALSHLLANGNLADVVLFGSFLVWAVADRISFKRREARPLPTAPATAINDGLVLVIGIGLYAAFVVSLHGILIGIPLLS